ncbi:GGDEF domain-containing protein [Rhodoferax lacus]|uniref:GGDEF domain-containing protein n=2 Tax=Rhodoferax lacus TaxID=2184758 RepID=A0A3E1R8A0_9BURK|nr:GGDEF domain-containing protein [Rhodoferax lacus]
MLLVALAAFVFMRYYHHALHIRTRAEQALLQMQAHMQASHDLLDRLSQHVPGVIYQYLERADGSSAFPYASQGLEEMFGVAPANFMRDGTPIFERVYADDSAALTASSQESTRSLSTWQHEFRINDRSGAIRWLSGLANPMRLDDGSTLWHGFIKDVTERKRLEARLTLAASVFTSAKEGILITDAAGTIVDVNETFCLITGFSHEEALGQNPRMLNSGRQPPEFYAQLWSSLHEKGHWYGEVWNRRKSGDVYAEMLTISSVHDAAGAIQNYVALFSDITPFKEHQQQLEHIAHYDALTGLPNRVLLADRLHQALIQSQRRKLCLAVVFLDLDGFKAVNDTHGHAAGDELLIALAQHMQSALREGDTLARIGGDEFVAILTDLEHAHDCEPILVRLLQTACEPVHLGQLDLRVSASMGVTLYPQDGAEVDLLMRQADQAMYAAKQAGKNRYHLFDVTQDAAIRQQRNSLERIEQGLALGQFVLFYQPKVNLRTGTVVGAEALIRWHHPERGLLYPAAFLPVIENHPVSIKLGEWVVHSALAQVSLWDAQGQSLPVSVNISALQLQQQDFPDRLRSLLADFPGLWPGLLELEVLETSAFEDLSRVSAIIAKCQDMGIRFALDDFGTGYSSLTYLKHLPVETLKIDQSFVRDMLIDANDLAIVNGIIGLARAFGRQVVAEGVETTAHRDLLVSIGCDVAQGFGIARPMPAKDFPAWVKQWQCHSDASNMLASRTSS